MGRKRQMAIVKNNSDFLFGFEAVMTNVNGDPDQENKPRMDYETMTALVSDARRKRDIRDFLKNKGFPIFVDVLAEQKVPMDKMLAAVLKDYMSNHEAVETMKEANEFLCDNWLVEEKWTDIYGELKKLAKEKKTKEQASVFNNILFTEIIKRQLIDIRMFGSAMAVEGFSKTYTGAVQITWGYSLHPVELVESNSITSIMNDDSSTFGKKYKLYYGHFAHYGTINKYAAKLTGMTERDQEIFRKALVQSMHFNQTDSKQGQIPQYYLEIIYKPEFDGYLGDLRRFIKIERNLKQAIRGWKDIKVDFTELDEKIKLMRAKGFVQEVKGWIHPSVNTAQMISFPENKPIELLNPII